jgi:CRISPR-associated protein Cas6
MTRTHLQPIVDMAFRLTGSSLPLDHGYLLFAALSRALQAFREDSHWGVHPVLGARTAPGVLAVTAHSRLRVRTPAADIAMLLSLTGQELDVGGHRVTVGVPEIFPLRPAAVLKSRFVTVKGFLEADDLLAALRRQLAAIPDLGQDPERVDMTLGPRRAMRVGPHVIVGYPLLLDGLETQASLALQSHGLGGRRHMGAGVLVPLGRTARLPRATPSSAAETKV